MKGFIMKELTGPQIAILFGLACTASAVATGLVLRTISRKLNPEPVSYLSAM
jgi:hypothetical protein